VAHRQEDLPLIGLYQDVERPPLYIDIEKADISGDAERPEFAARETTAMPGSSLMICLAAGSSGAARMACP